MHKYSPQFSNDEGGAATVWSIFWAIVFLTIGGLVIDTSNAYRHKAALQATADASSLAAIISYTEKTKFDLAFGAQNPEPATPSARGKLAGHLLANNNMDPAKAKGTVTPESEVTMGHWSTDAQTFTPEDAFTTGMKVNAAKVRSLRTASNNNPLNLLLVDLFGPADFWDVGATSIAMTFQPVDCPSKEGIMTGGTLFFNTNGTFVGDICLHGEEAINFQPGNKFQTFQNPDGSYPEDGPYPIVSYGKDGEMCKGVCTDEEPWSQILDQQDSEYPLTVDMVDPGATHMPDVESIYGYFAAIVTAPWNYTGPEGGAEDGGNGANRYFPDALVVEDNRDRDPVDTPVVPIVWSTQEADAAALTLPEGATYIVDQGYLRISISASDFEKAMNGVPCNGANCTPIPASETSPFPAHSIIEIDGGIEKEDGTGGSCTVNGQNNSITIDSITPLEDVVVSSPCKFTFNGPNEIEGTLIMTSGDGQHAMDGNSGAILGNGTCENDADGSTFVALGDIHFAEGVNVRSSRIYTRGDIHIAANGDGMQGTQIVAEGDAHITSNGEWAGCPNGLANSAVEVDHYYQLVF